jgi:hypothetical protein
MAPLHAACESWDYSATLAHLKVWAGLLGADVGDGVGREGG